MIKKKQICVSFSPEQLKRLRKEAQKQEVSIAHILRRAATLWLKEIDKKGSH